MPDFTQHYQSLLEQATQETLAKRTQLYAQARSQLLEALDAAQSLEGDAPRLSDLERMNASHALEVAIRAVEQGFRDGTYKLTPPARPKRAAAAKAPEPEPEPALFAYLGTEDPHLVPRRDTALSRRLRVISTLFGWNLRKLGSQSAIAYLWLFLEPMAQIALVIAFQLFFERTTVLDMAIVPFAILGVGAWLIFRVVTMRLASGSPPDSQILLFPRVSALDGYIARAMVPLVLYGSGALVLLIIGARLGAVPPPEKPAMALGYLAAIWLTALGLGLITAGLENRFPAIKRVMPVFMRPLFFITGVMFVTEQLPHFIAEYLLWNPFLHQFQLLRSAYFAGYETQDALPGVALGLMSATLLLGLLFVAADRRTIRTV
ncbi:MAG: ABC transporter permease [Neomegalonema sp.]|nr:ABC transporter permease [Neomegalonema sp.]